MSRYAGLNVSHDNYYYQKKNLSTEDGAISWPHAFNLNTTKGCRYSPWAWQRQRRRRLGLPSDKRNFLHVVHIVREPLKSLTSRWNMGQMAWYAQTACQLQVRPCQLANQQQCTIFQTLEHWVLWNSFIEMYAEKRYQIESNNDKMIHDMYRLGDLPGVEDNQLTPPFLSIKSVSILEDYRIQSGKRISNSGHTRKPKKPFTWDQLMTVDKNYTIMAQYMAHRYGYAVNISQDFYNLRQVCGLDEQRRWGCHLESFDTVEKAQLKTAISLNVEILSRGR